MSKFLLLATLVLPLLSMPIEEVSDNPGALEARQTNFGYYGESGQCPLSNVVSGPKGHATQWTQVTDNLDCGDPGDKNDCTVGKLKQKTFGVEAGAAVAGNIVGMSAAVTREITSGEEYNCNGHDGGVVCVWFRTAYTKFDMQTNCGEAKKRKSKEVKFPNANNKDGGFYCQRDNKCDSINAHYWE